MLLSMSICQALVYECKVTKDWAISRYDIIEKSYEIQQRMTAIAKIPIGFSLKKSGLGNESLLPSLRFRRVKQDTCELMINIHPMP